MKNKLIIILLIIFSASGFNCFSQTEHGLIPYSNKLLLNPSFAGFNKSSSIWSNLQYLAGYQENVNHTFSITYDKWSDRLRAGTAWYFYQGLTGMANTNRTGAGFTFSKPIELNDNQIIPSLNINYLVYSKQWLVHTLDGILDKDIDPYSSPGVSFMRYNILNPRMGLLWNSAFITAGISASYSYQHQISHNEDIPSPEPFHFVFHASQKMRGKQKGLESQPFKASPELVLLFSENLIMSRVGFRMEQVGNLMALFVQNNYTDNIHGVAGIFGWRIENINISLTSGAAYSVPTKKPLLFGEISLGFVVPYTFLNFEDPWAPPTHSY